MCATECHKPATIVWSPSSVVAPCFRRTLECGTTTACYFGTIHVEVPSMLIWGAPDEDTRPRLCLNDCVSFMMFSPMSIMFRCIVQSAMSLDWPRVCPPAPQATLQLAEVHGRAPGLQHGAPHQPRGSFPQHASAMAPSPYMRIQGQGLVAGGISDAGRGHSGRADQTACRCALMSGVLLCQVCSCVRCALLPGRGHCVDWCTRCPMPHVQ